MAIDSDLACTITLTSGSKDFTIAGASLVTADIQPGDEIKLPLKGLTLTIGEVLTATTGRLTDNCPAAAAGAAQAARLRYQSDLSRAAAKFENLTTLLGNGNVDALAGLTLANNKGIHATGLNTLGTYDLTPYARNLLASADGGAARTTLGVLSNAATQIPYRGIFTPNFSGGDITPSDVTTIVGGAGYYVFAASTSEPMGGLPSPFPAGSGTLVGYNALGSAYRYSFQEFTTYDAVTHIWRRWATSATTWGPWRMVYDSSNVIGAVSQSGGVPTGALSTGWLSNAGGLYKRDADGTQTCISPGLLIADSTQVVGSGFITGAGGRISWTYPIAFTSVMSIQARFIGVDYADVGVTSTSNTSATGIYLKTAASKTGLTVPNVQIRTEGMWF